jgi:NADH-quinone oxidoreductase subunit J
MRTDERARDRLVRLLAVALPTLAAVAAALLGGVAVAAGQDVTFTVGAVPSVPAGTLWTFRIVALLTGAGALATITRRNPVTAAVCLVATLFCSAGLYLLLHATFLAVIQVLVYAGAIMVLFVLVIMSVERPEQEELGLLRGTGAKVVGVAAMIWLMYRVFSVLVSPEVRRPAPVHEAFGSVTSIGKQLFGDYLFPFEAISILLLVAIVGAVAVSRHRASVDDEPAAPVAEKGRQP